MITSTPSRKIADTGLSKVTIGFFNRIATSRKSVENAQKIHDDEKNYVLEYVYKEMIQQLGKTKHNVVFMYKQVSRSGEKDSPLPPTLLQELIFRAIDVENGNVIPAIMEIFHDRFFQKTKLRLLDSVREACAHFNSCLRGKYELHVKKNPADGKTKATLCFLFQIK